MCASSYLLKRVISYSWLSPEGAKTSNMPACVRIRTLGRLRACPEFGLIRKWFFCFLFIKLIRLYTYFILLLGSTLKIIFSKNQFCPLLLHCSFYLTHPENWIKESLGEIGKEVHYEIVMGEQMPTKLKFLRNLHPSFQRLRIWRWESGGFGRSL